MLTYKVEQKNNVIILHIDGYLFMNTVKYAESIWTKQVLKQPSVIAIDCKNLKQVDSTAIGTLVKFFNNAMSEKIKLVFYDLNDSIFRLFQTAKLNRFFSVTTKQNFESQYILCKQ